jgi:hypothetical protein
MSLVEHYASRARRKGCYADTRLRVQQLEADESGFFCGIRKAVADSLAGFVVPEDEVGQWWLMKSEAERGVQIFLPIDPKPVVRKRRK